MWPKNPCIQSIKLQEVEVVGLLTEPSFHMAVHAVEELRGETWEYPSNVMCFVDNQLLGDEKMLLKWAYDVWDYKDFKPIALYEAITSDFLTKYLKAKKVIFGFLKVSLMSIRYLEFT
ncbi:hypothetical protein Chor_006769 [Crotalus horridus]